MSADRLQCEYEPATTADAAADSGFTLVEVIVALAILSVGLGVLLGSISDSLWRTANAERMEEASSLAQSLIAESAATRPFRLEERTGESPGRYRWHLKIDQFGDAREREEWPVGAYAISATVAWEAGGLHRSVALTTLRLGPKAVPR